MYPDVLLGMFPVAHSGALLHLPREELYGTVARLEVGDSDAK